MELKYTNFNGEVVLGRYLNFVKTEFKNKSLVIFFQKDTLIAPQTRLAMTFTQKIQME